MEAIDRAIKHFGSQAALAADIGVKQPTVSEWLRGDRPVPPDRCPEIEKSTGVRCEDLRPDLTWYRGAPSEEWPIGKPYLDVEAPPKTTPDTAEARAV
jgi:DNA-binding transcriptional regulator YdaS (Cro superfamily)